MHIPTRTEKLTFFLIVLLLTVYAYPLLPRAHAASVNLTVLPTEGYVGDKINLSGQIDNANGSYSIFFDSSKVANGTSNSLKRFTNTFSVPRSKYGAHNITLQDESSSNFTIAGFKVKTSYEIRAINVPAYPQQLQEGSILNVAVRMLGANATTSYPKNITLTTPGNNVYYNSSLMLTTDENGTAENVPPLRFPTDFLPANGHTNYTGNYRLRVYKNATTTLEAESTFSIGLTNAILYQRNDVVNITAMNYTRPNENATVAIKFGNKTVRSNTVKAVNGTIKDSWPVPVTASKGNYKVTVVTAIQNGTTKQVPDAQNFTIPGLSLSIFAKNLNDEPVSGVNATVYEIAQNNRVKVATGISNSSGYVTSTIDHGGNYTLRAFWKNVNVSETQIYDLHSNRSDLTLNCQLARMELTIIDGKSGLPMPRVYLMLNTYYVTIANQSRSEGEIYITNDTGKWLLSNMLVKANYSIRAYRTGLTYLPETLFKTLNFTNSQSEKLFKMNVTCPAFSLTVCAQDAKQAAIGNSPVEIFEYMGGLYAQATTGADSGNATLDCIVGRYFVRLYNPEKTIILSETLYNVTTDNSFLALSSSIQHADLFVKVVDYLGQPVSNIKVRLERENATPINRTTIGNGTALFSNILGGNCMVLVYLGEGEPTETMIIYVENITATTVTLGRYISMFGILVETTQLAVYLTLIILLVLFMVFYLYQRRRQKPPSNTTEEKKS